GWAYQLMDWSASRTGWSLLERRNLKRLFIVSITGIVPALIILLFEDPVQVMSASGIIAALHTPFIVLTALLVNLRRLPVEHRPSLFFIGAMTLAGVFYLVFGCVYLWSLVAPPG
ncbi:MAG: divalent metal cation transporter, partial [Haliea sp.]